MNTDPNQHFPRDYQSARRAFLSVAEQRRAQVSSHPISRRGPRGEELAIDAAYLGPQAPQRHGTARGAS